VDNSIQESDRRYTRDQKERKNILCLSVAPLNILQLVILQLIRPKSPELSQIQCDGQHFAKIGFALHSSLIRIAAVHWRKS
jgi:hypothetical protein